MQTKLITPLAAESAAQASPVVTEGYNYEVPSLYHCVLTLSQAPPVTLPVRPVTTPRPPPPVTTPAALYGAPPAGGSRRGRQGRRLSSQRR